jgi:hypothetical protein
MNFKGSNIFLSKLTIKIDHLQKDLFGRQSIKNRPAPQRLAHNTPKTPHINLLAINLGSQQDLRRPIPLGGNFLSFWFLELILVRTAHQAEITNFCL